MRPGAHAMPRRRRAWSMLRLCFVTRALTAGGSERQLVELAGRLDPSEFQVSVLTFYPGGELWRELEGRPGIRLLSLDKRGRWDLIGFGWRAWRQLRREAPDIVHGYLGTANELALLGGRLVGAKVVWRVGAAWMDLSLYDWAWSVAFRLGAWLSRWPDRIVVNSEASYAHHRQAGWTVDRMVVVRNGFDTERFRPDAEGRLAVRADWSIPLLAPLIGLIARLDPIKDHETFLRAAAELLRSHPEARFACVGDGPAGHAATLRSLAGRLGLDGRVVWAGSRSDMTAVYSACDIVTLCSRGESLPNALGEAMACGVPCVATRVGDVPALLGDAGVLVPPRDPAALAAAWRSVIDLSPAARQQLGARGRDRIRSEFDMSAFVGRMARILRDVGAGPSPSKAAGA
jgi:glycosyltransferase involved in cell wall biosynthesis